MSTALEGLGDGIGECDIVAGKRDFSVKFDPNKVSQEKLLEAMNGTGKKIAAVK